MQLIPDWAPNVHPMIIHFPIALLLVAAFIDALSIWFRQDWLYKTTLMMYLFGTFGAIAAYISGRNAADSVSPSFQAELTMSNHSDSALYTIVFFSIYTILRLIFRKKISPENKFIHLAALVVVLGGLYLLVRTGDLGGRLVFKYGVGQLN